MDDKQKWWSTLTADQKAEIKSDPEWYREMYETFGAFTVSSETYEGVIVKDYQPHRREK